MPVDEVAALVRAVRIALAEIADPAKAPEMRRYMKSEMPFRGVQKPARRTVARQVFADHPLTTRDSFLEATLRLWREAEFREERYLAIDLTGDRRYRRWQDTTLLPLYDELIVTGAWWDYVDEIAIRRVGPILQADPETVGHLMRRWAVDNDLWRRRTAVICQVGCREDVDRALLTKTIEATMTDSDFFLRKGIGWALRELGKIDPKWVATFVAEHPALSPLSVREALKYVPSAAEPSA